ncbi:MAG TPA: ribonuclease PH, partial [Myxococcota bacterium]|nr:ribonuclease PH [Myxococcota bacterium]
MNRGDGRAHDELRKVEIDLGFTENPAGSVLIRTGRTMVLCTATIEKSVPGWLRGSGRGWVTAEYSMLPGSTDTRSEREAQKGKLSGRTQEIQR